MSTALTGIPHGALITGIGGDTTGVILRYMGPPISPRAEFLNLLRRSLSFESVNLIILAAAAVCCLVSLLIAVVSFNCCCLVSLLISHYYSGCR
jgi:hypothetical protein